MTAWFTAARMPSKPDQPPMSAPRQRCSGIVPPPPRFVPRPPILGAPKASPAQAAKERESAWHRIRIATTGSIRHIQDWLDTHCEGRWHVGVTGVDKHLATKFAEVHFEQAADKQRFKAMFAARPALAA